MPSILPSDKVLPTTSEGEKYSAIRAPPPPLGAPPAAEEVEVPGAKVQPPELEGVQAVKRRRGCFCCCWKAPKLPQLVRRRKGGPALLPFFVPVLESASGSVYCLPKPVPNGEQQLAPEHQPLSSFEFRPTVALAPEPGEQPQGSSHVVLAGPEHADKKNVMFFVVERSDAPKGTHFY